MHDAAVVCLKCGVKAGQGDKFCENYGCALKVSRTTSNEHPVNGFGGAIKACFGKYANPFIGWIFHIAFIILGLAVSVRRLHDIGKADGIIYLV